MKRTIEYTVLTTTAVLAAAVSMKKVMSTRAISNSLLGAILAGFIVAPLDAQAPAHTTFNIHLWPGGVVHFRFASPADHDPYRDRDIGVNEVLNVGHENFVLAQMKRWRDSMTVTDPSDSNRTTRHISFRACTWLDCPPSHVLIRLNFPDETNNMCSYTPSHGEETPGLNPEGVTVLHFSKSSDPLNPTPMASNTVLHELGHCLGLWHEFNRHDRRSWLKEKVDMTSYHFRAPELMPLLGNYDYDSLMHYGSYKDGAIQFRDYWENAFSRQQTEILARADATVDAVSAWDKSRLLQYYAREQQPNWGFFTSVNNVLHLGDSLPDKLLANGVEAVGTPAIADQGNEDLDIFARGSDNHLYWKQYRRGDRGEGGEWTPIGCCFGSDPAAISRRSGEIDVAIIGAFSGKLERNHLENGAWGGWHYVRDGYPTGGIKTAAGGFVGPAIASRSSDSLDIFVVKNSGVLAFTTLSSGQWSSWQTLGSDYEVTARPAAVALSSTVIKLAVNVSDDDLFEPTLTTSPYSFGMGPRKAKTAYRSPPALTRRSDLANPYRVLIVTANKRIAHRFAIGNWFEIGGIPAAQTGPSAVQLGSYGAFIVMNGKSATGCKNSCLPGDSPDGNATYIQPGGLWLRRFE